ncbi:MAG: long-chain fatty acid--CoA ligase [Thermodesulfobacteriota bacterium]
MSDSRPAGRPWFSSYDQGVPASLAYEQITVVEAVKRAAALFPGKDAVVCQGFSLTYAELADQMDSLAAALASFGLAKGDRAAILLPNGVPAVIAYFAVLSLGCVAVFGNPDFSDRELSHLLNDSGCKLAIALDLDANRLIDLRPLTSARQIVVAGLGDFLPFPRSLLFPLLARKKGLSADVKKAQDVYRFKDLLQRSAPTPPAVSIELSDPACFSYTGGTTGIAKGVVLTHENLAVNVQQIAAWFPFLQKGGETVLGALPFFTALGLTAVVNLSAWMAATVAVATGATGEDLVAALKKTKPTFAPLTPNLVAALAAHPELAPGSLKAAFSSGAAVDPETLKAFEEKAGAPVIEAYGLTEASPLVCANPSGGSRKAGSLGLPLPDTDCRLVDIALGEDDVPSGEPGELIVRGPQVMAGYWNNNEETNEALRDGWLFTGDIATVDPDGFFFLTDRKKDLIVSGGLNVYPKEVEEVLCSHPKIVEACALGIPHPIRGEAVKVFAVIAPGETASEEEIILFLKERLAPFKLPAEIEFRENLPKSNVGKILKKELKEQEGNRGR